jgi:hypothetical protein
MGMFRIFKMPQNQQFQYRPRFWDQEKEELEKRMRKIQNPEEVTAEEIKDNISMTFRNRGGGADPKFRSQQVMKSNKILVLTILILAIFAYFILSSNMDFLEKLVN